MKYLQITRIDCGGKERATSDMVNQLLRDDATSKAVKNRFNYINGNVCNILGSESIIYSFMSIDSRKFDIKTQIRNVEFLGFSNDEIELCFNDDEPKITAVGIYDFTDTFLEKYKLDKFKKYCIKNKMNSLIKNNIVECMQNDPSALYQFRLISDEEKSYLRAITTDKYKNYDNHIALYIALNTLHRYADTNAIDIRATEGYISDSSLDINFVFGEKIDLEDGWYMQIGVKVLNNEIRQGAFSIELIYSIYNSNNPDKNIMTYTAISDKIIDIVHTRTVETIEQEFSKLMNIEGFIESMVSNAKKVKSNNVLDPDQIYKLFELFSNNRTMSSSTRKLLKSEKDTITRNTHNLIDIFDKLSTLVTSVDEKTHLQRLFDEFIKTL